MIISTVFLCVHQFCETMVPVAIGLIVGRAIDTGDGTAMIISLLALAGLFVVLSYAFRFGARIIVVAIEREAHMMRVEIAGRVLHPRGVRTDLVSGELLSVSTSDAEKTSWILDVIARTAAAITATLVSAIALLVIDIPLGLAVVIATPVIMFGLQRAAPLLTKAATAQQAEVARVSGMATDLVGGVRPLRGIGAEDAASARFFASSRTALSATMKMAKANSIYLGFSTTVSALLSVGIAGAAGLFALQGRISVGELITVVGLSQFIIEPLTTMSRLPGVAAVVRGSADRLALVLGADHVLAEAGSVAPPATDIAAAGIAYRSLDGFDLSAAPGELLGVVALRPQDGEALAAVLSGQISEDDYLGTVTIGGLGIGELGLADARRTVLVEPHNTDLFAGTVRTNVSAGRAREDHELDRILAASAATDVVAMHEHGLDHAVTDRGASLSGGQRQRVALARALSVSAPVLVLHDPTTAVDAVTEHSIAAGIKELRHSADRAQTTILITTSPALLAVTDRVVVVDDGRVVAEGTHHDLAVTDERYKGAVLR
ncbi:ABC transporter ATP-binding protein [Rhodococcus sp. PAMC28707]|uniref:ABC transporter transmembrane domain-containing protein n=1 Tax=unclassified Rhodococcus (in: high G+C Gram-positive bacteria) TaxID=192944 RepID=UPI00109DF8D9|nr:MULTISPECIES: ABC transporter ATP-binding protein [unclassified Rhodococcus (in: high G+C Gram-positive bacteria)]QCB50009.1 ABC transporter ATP-binding protein [Rhodococcus sp. PAMC28705]QCB58296.1 ABC transporter ATP-binding protein [Rhodococcus sp. PAMC28707]